MSRGGLPSSRADPPCRNGFRPPAVVATVSRSAWGWECRKKGKSSLSVGLAQVTDRLRSGPLLSPEHLLEGGDCYFDLVAVGRLGGHLLKPEAGSHECPHQGGPVVLGTKPEHLVGDPRDERDGDQTGPDPPREAGRSEQ